MQNIENETRERRREYNRKYRETHPLDWNTKLTCECGIVHSVAYKPRHLRTQLHNKFLETGIPYREHPMEKSTWFPITHLFASDKINN